MKTPLPVREGVAPSYLWLPPGQWPTLLDFLRTRFGELAPGTWEQRMQAGEVRSADGSVLDVDSPYVPGMRIFYYREVPDEVPAPQAETVLYRDERILVVDKPHFMAVTPSGRFLKHTLLVRLRQQTGLDHLVPVHRLDRETAGLVIFCIEPALRGQYQALFREGQVHKEYEAVAGPAPQWTFPLERSSRIVEGERFFTMRESAGAPNAHTRIEVLERGEELWRYRLTPATGKTHQLRLHMLGLGAPILNDLLYPKVFPVGAEDFDRPLQLLARRLRFTDPVSGQAMQFESRLRLMEISDDDKGKHGSSCPVSSLAGASPAK